MLNVNTRKHSDFLTLRASAAVNKFVAVNIRFSKDFKLDRQTTLIESGCVTTMGNEKHVNIFIRIQWDHGIVLKSIRDCGDVTYNQLDKKRIQPGI